MADNIKYRFIQNVGDYFPAGYFGEDFIDRVQKLSCYSNDEVEHVCSRYRQDVLRLVDAFRGFGLFVSSVVITTTTRTTLFRSRSVPKTASSAPTSSTPVCCVNWVMTD